MTALCDEGSSLGCLQRDLALSFTSVLSHLSTYTCAHAFCSGYQWMIYRSLGNSVDTVEHVCDQIWNDL